MNDEKRPRTLNDILGNGPFDDMSVTLDTRYVDIGIGYNKKTGSRIAATIDLNSFGKKTEDDVRSAKAKYQEEVMRLDLERRRLINESIRAGKNISVPTIEPLDIKIDPTPERKPPVFPTINTQEPPTEEKTEETEESKEPVNFMGAKAFIDD